MLIIIHGWSDNYTSFKTLARKLAAAQPEGIAADIRHVRLGDYVTLDDQVNYEDLVEAMQRAWTDLELPTAHRSVDVVIHSTGGLVVRHWITRYFTPDTVPIKRLLMLAPANFGSPLAHTGRSMVGRAVKGWKGTRLFETGAQILKGLEIASPYTWKLAEKDLLGEQIYYGPGRILCTVLVGNAGYKGISALANQPGTDGTVRVSTANLNAAAFELDFTDPTREVLPRMHQTQSGTAFGIADLEDHSSIAAKGGGPRRQPTWALICNALRVEDEGFTAWQQQLEEHNRNVTEQAEKRRSAHYNSYQNTVIRVVDHHGTPVTDYVIELFANDDKGQRNRLRTQRLQEQAINKVHAWSGDASYRSFLINCTELYKIIDQPEDRLNISLTAVPELSSGLVGYKTYTDEDISTLSLNPQELKAIFQPHRTLLITIVLKRYQKEAVFQFKNAV